MDLKKVACLRLYQLTEVFKAIDREERVSIIPIKLQSVSNVEQRAEVRGKLD